MVSKGQTVCIQMRPYILLVPIWVINVCKAKDVMDKSYMLLFQAFPRECEVGGGGGGGAAGIQ